MSEIFIKLTIDEGKCISRDGCRTCIGVCTVAIFKEADDKTRVVVDEANEDECTLCNLCLNKSKNAIKVKKLY